MNTEYSLLLFPKTQIFEPPSQALAQISDFCNNRMSTIKKLVSNITNRKSILMRRQKNESLRNNLETQL
ncbi:hypothetical protein LEP1GSC062_4505 [Leptospira alexanderi serovar Manhao 3 str. L 60]|uniref:Uncharacterized protein n=1 Tax=Leptospira alexanderi serovar Manhao 3 str. L 60 TaxID=1049759 RepID=V6I1R1_9LEPT|nr:hypothetical protein LEP1GSC062_4505 [Leptospira alexanderi serovar Manhao 3 str. L 60]